jgi:hypothetical protein
MGDSGFVAAVGTALPLRALGTYGVYVVCIDTEGCRGGGTGLLRTNKGFEVGAVGVDGGEAIEKLDTDDDGDDDGSEVEVAGGLGGTVIELGTISG